jgi:hypothetical protein
VEAVRAREADEDGEFSLDRLYLLSTPCFSDMTKFLPSLYSVEVTAFRRKITGQMWRKAAAMAS